MGSDESHFNVSVGSDGQSHKVMFSMVINDIKSKSKNHQSGKSYHHLNPPLTAHVLVPTFPESSVGPQVYSIKRKGD